MAGKANPTPSDPYTTFPVTTIEATVVPFVKSYSDHIERAVTVSQTPV